MVETIENSLVASLLKILNSFFKPYIETEANKVHPEQIEQLENNLEGLFLYACIWSIGCTTDYEGRLKFNTYLHELIKENKYIFLISSTFKIPGMVYDFNFDQEKSKFYPWNDDIKDF